MIYMASLPPDHQYIGIAQAGLARALVEEGRVDEASTAATRALVILRERLPAGHPQLANAQAVAAQVLALQGKRSEAEPLLAASFKTLSSAYGLNDARTRMASKWLGEARRRD